MTHCLKQGLKIAVKHTLSTSIISGGGAMLYCGKNIQKNFIAGKKQVQKNSCKSCSLQMKLTILTFCQSFSTSSPPTCYHTSPTFISFTIGLQLPLQKLIIQPFQMRFPMFYFLATYLITIALFNLSTPPFLLLIFHFYFTSISIHFYLTSISIYLFYGCFFFLPSIY